MAVNATFPQSCFPFESINSHERIMLSQKNVKWNKANQKVVKEPGYFSLMEKIDTSNLHTDQNNF